MGRYKATILPLDGKYYGTAIRVIGGGREWVFKLWDNGNSEPSERELDGRCTITQWRKNEVLDKPDGWGNPTVKAKDLVEICDSHFESSETYALAKHLVSLINKEAKDA